MASTVYPDNYVDLNSLDTKQLNIVVLIEGTSTVFSLVPTYQKIRYGQPGLKYGQAGIVYGGLVQVPNNKTYLSPTSNLTIGQKIEPEQGRSSASTMSLDFVDVNGFMSEFVSPGQDLDELMGGKLVRIFIGFANSSFKEDYFCVFRGYVSQTNWTPTKVTLQLTDPNIKRRQQIFYLGKSIVSDRSLQIPISDFDLVNNKINFTAHGLVTNSKFQLSLPLGGSLPSNLIAGTDYYAVRLDNNSFQISATAGGSPFAFGTGGSGTPQLDVSELGDDVGLVYFDNTSDFLTGKLGPDGSYDTSIIPYVRIDNEYLQYAINDPKTNNAIEITIRGARDSIAVTHTVETEADAQFSMQGNIVDLALKIMLSGGDPITGSVFSFGITNDSDFGTVSNMIILPNGVNAVDDLGLAAGAYFVVTGSSNGNDKTYIIQGFDDILGYPNNGIYVDQVVTPEQPTSAIYSSRSQYDTFPDAFMTAMSVKDIDVAGWQYIQDNFVFQADNVFEILITQPETGKDFIEQELLLPAGLYGITRYGRISCSATKPPVAQEGLVTLDNTNVINPQSIMVQRSLNTRRFYNELQYSYDMDNDGNPTTISDSLDTDSLNLFGVSSVLPITSRGLRTSLGANSFIARRGGFILRRYRNIAYEINIQTNFKAGSMIEVSDAVALVDNGGLQIINFQTGKRDIGAQLFEVIQRQLDLKAGTATLTLLAQIGYDITDRFGGIAPSSLVGSGSTTTQVRIIPSFLQKYGPREWRKWKDIIGDQLYIHKDDYSEGYTTRFLGFSSVNNNILLIDPIANIGVDWVVDLAPYDESASTVNQKSKLLYSYIDKNAYVVTGTSDLIFTVSSGDAANLAAGQLIYIHNADYSNLSEEVFISSVVGTTVTVKTSLGYTPSNGDQIELIGFLDSGGAYRIL